MIIEYSLRYKMNIFWLDLSIALCSIYHCDQHCVKMILETTQLLYTAHWVIDKNLLWSEKLTPYRKTHQDHICAVWARSSKNNYYHLAQLGLELCKEFTFRRDKTHQCQQHLEWLSTNIPDIPGKIDDPLDINTIPLAMPDQYKIPGNPVESYRRYYIGDKQQFAKWKWGRLVPKWFNDPQLKTSLIRSKISDIEIERKLLKYDIDYKKLLNSKQRGGYLSTDLKQFCKKMRLITSGKKIDVVDRILYHVKYLS